MLPHHSHRLTSYPCITSNDGSFRRKDWVVGEPPLGMGTQRCQVCFKELQSRHSKYSSTKCNVVERSGMPWLQLLSILDSSGASLVHHKMVIPFRMEWNEVIMSWYLMMNEWSTGRTALSPEVHGYVRRKGGCKFTHLWCSPTESKFTGSRIGYKLGNSPTNNTPIDRWVRQ